MLDYAISQIYDKLRLHFFLKVYSRYENREATLTTVETFSMEIIMAMNEPTIAEFAKTLNISSPNAAHRIKCLVQKGYLEKVQSKDDGREFHLRPTKKYLDFCKINQDYLKILMKRCEKRFSPEDYKKLNEMLDIINKELMPELDIEAFKNTSI
ncbi:MarR family winged helix-turn-helix transcriptional regulator [Butyrivibrio sp. WCE2006]|uniref:MarR family winged helix-turn-helix transcriptional regulator n=1 Tax=Butyrivibrio sp. WCE2006 TaxID=1410611 RepID=UPI0005D2BE15|nr:MarR family winged helix-turn-helix transcriptional regulator [Butyrivibrio sp. WCE2006]